MWPELKELALKYIRRYWPPEGSFPAVDIPPRPEPTTSRLIRWLLHVLPAVPWILGGLLVAAVAGLDFEGFRIVFAEARLSLLRDGELMAQSVALGLAGPVISIGLDNLLLTIAVSGMIGYATNWLAITMLFQPRRRRPLLGQGFIPAQQEIVIDRLSRAISIHIVNAEHLKTHIHDSGILHWAREFAVRLIEQIVADKDFRTEGRALVRRLTEELLAKEEVKSKITQIALDRLREAPKPIGPAIVVYDTVNRASLENQINKLIDMLPGSVDAIWDELDLQLDKLPANIEAAADEVEEWLTQAILHLVGQLNMYDLIAQNLAKLDPEEIERIIKSAARAELKYIRYLGGVLGAFGGLVIISTWLLVPVSLGLGVVVGLDCLLVWAGQKRQQPSDPASTLPPAHPAPADG